MHACVCVCVRASAGVCVCVCEVIIWVSMETKNLSSFQAVCELHVLTIKHVLTDLF
jgi:hypothetical protein